jgi:hypothetical protein
LKRDPNVDLDSPTTAYSMVFNSKRYNLLIFQGISGPIFTYVYTHPVPKKEFFGVK